MNAAYIMFMNISSWLLALAVLPVAISAAPDCDHPPFVTDHNGVFHVSWGGGFTAPEQLFWENLPDIKTSLLQMQQSADDDLADGKMPVMSVVSWGWEYIAASGGDSALGISDYSKKPGWKQWGEWVTANKDQYLARDWDGNIFYPGAGYITPLMPMDSADQPAGMTDANFGDWAGERFGKMAKAIHCRGFMAADFWVGLYGGNHDFHPRVINDFEKWAGVTVPGFTIKERADYIKAHYWPQMLDYRADRYAHLYAKAAETIRAAGNEPLVGGQILPDAPMVRGTGNDFRIYLKYLPAKNWYFQVELQSDDGRPVVPYFATSARMGIFASREPDFRLGSHMDADLSSFWDAVHGAKQSDAWGFKYLKHHWLSVGFSHVLNRDGSVRRSTYAFLRGYWDVGKTDSVVMDLIYSHIPRHPFGPAIYYSSDLERQSESTGNPNFYWWVTPRSEGWLHDGMPVGYYAADVALDKITEVNKPSGWFVYVDNLGFTSLKDTERAKLETIAPIVDETNFKQTSPMYFEGDSLGGYAFIDQNGSVIVLVSNSDTNAVNGSVVFNKVENGSYTMTDLIAGTQTSLAITSNGIKVPLKIAGRETMVFEIPNLRQQGRAGLDYTATLPVKKTEFAPTNTSPTLHDALGRKAQNDSRVYWSK